VSARTVSQAVAKREDGPVKLMWSKGPHFAAVLPDHIDVKAFLGTAAGALYADEDLMRAAENHPDSLITTLMRCAALGHQPGTEEYYLHIRKGKVSGTEGYRGIVERMYRSGAVKKVVVREVCAKDPFDFVEGEHDRPVHEIGGRGGTGAAFFGEDGSRDRGRMVGVYAWAELTTGAISRVVVLSREDVMAARDSSDAKDSKFSPWNRLDGGPDHPEFTGRSMWWKTAARRLEPWVPTSAEYRREQLRAASAASDIAGVRSQSAGRMSGGPSEQIYDAEIVEDPAAAVETARQTPRPAAAATGRLGKLLLGMRLGTPEDLAAYLEWITGHPAIEALTADDVAAVTRHIDDAVAAAHGDTEAARDAIWTAYQQAHPRDDEAAAEAAS
jgi:recombination protein RecT